MGFCRRCGDIVSGPRCKCGGLPVAPVVQWNSDKDSGVDKWSRTYVTKEGSPTRTKPPVIDSPSPHSRSQSSESTNKSSHPLRRPRSSSSLGNRVSQYLAATSRPASPLKQSAKASLPQHDEPIILSHRTGTHSDILPSLYAPELSKVYGSVLQPKESRASYRCALCTTEFPPDATIYPNPRAPEGFEQFLCRSCFVENGGSKGDCASCHRPVLILKSEGGFVEASSRVWHKRCFQCNGCAKYIGDAPMVDLLGRPSCADCFDTCLKRDPTPTQPRALVNFNSVDSPTSLGGSRSRSNSDRRESGSPMDELQQRLGVLRKRQSSPALEVLARRLSDVLDRPPTKGSPTESPSAHDNDYSAPLRPTLTGSSYRERRVSTSYTSRTVTPRASRDRLESFEHSAPQTPASTTGYKLMESSPYVERPSRDAVEEMKRRFLKPFSSSPDSIVSQDTGSQSSSLSSDLSLVKSPTITPSKLPVAKRPSLRNSASCSSLGSPFNSLSRMPTTPDLLSDTSDTTSQSSLPSSPATFDPKPTNVVDIMNVEERSPHFSSSRSFRSDSIVDGQRQRRLSTKLSREALNPAPLQVAALTADSLCAKCGGSLFSVQGGGHFVTVPEVDSSRPPKTYHNECFRCSVCDRAFKETQDGQALFVRGEGGACHAECTPPEHVYSRAAAILSPVKRPAPLEALTIKSSTPPTRRSMLPISKPTSSSRYEAPTPTAPVTSSPFQRFGTSSVCGGCHKSVSPMEKDTVPGPQGSRWHSSCLVCGGKSARLKREKTRPGCAKRLDSAAKRDSDGNVWCRECFLLLPSDVRTYQTHHSHSKSLVSSPSRSASIFPQNTGTTTIARQFTGRGPDPGVMRQLTGESSSTRQRAMSISPSKQLAKTRPRPKSVIGMRSSREEGRGMFLVRQMTGASFGV